MANSDVGAGDRHEAERRRMVERQLARRGIREERVLYAMGRVPREAFLPADLAEFAYDDNPLPIAEGQTISQPYIVALMAEAARIAPEARILEVGTGSGYAAAVYAELAREVVTIERHPVLAEGAAEVLRRLNYAGVEVRQGDGSLGAPDRAPYAAILVAAGAPAPPDSLKDQLAEGGRLVVPVSVDSHQELKVIIRRGDSFEEESLGPVRFVPLMGAEGWLEHELEGASVRRSGARPPAPRLLAEPDLARAIAAEGCSFGSADGDELAALFDDIGGARVVLLGEATHGTSEFYRARAAITRRLIERHGFNIVAVEADWPDAAQIDRHVRGREASFAGEPAFTRFPVWMWRNREFRDFADWLRGWNAGRPAADRASFHGLDLYGLSSSIAAVIDYLQGIDPEAARVARERYACLTPWQKDPSAYGRAALLEGNRRCEKAVLDMLGDLLARRLDYLAGDPDDYLEAEGNARLVTAAETYYRTMYYGYAESWNQRDTHMFETLERVMVARGPGSRAVVWAHNSHVGNAAATEMGLVRDEINIGQLARQRFGGEAVLVGFGTDRGEVAAATDWGGPMEIKAVRPAHPESYESLFHRAGAPRLYLDLAAGKEGDAGHSLLKPRLERAIGVIYRPETELASHYFEASLPQQFDRYLWFDVTHAVAPLAAASGRGGADTYPFGL